MSESYDIKGSVHAVSETSERALQKKYLVNLRQLLETRLVEGELRTLCYDLNVDYDSLPDTGKANKARELIIYLENRSRIPALVELLRERRPDIWQDADRATGEVAASFPRAPHERTTG